MEFLKEDVPGHPRSRVGGQRITNLYQLFFNMAGFACTRPPVAFKADGMAYPAVDMENIFSSLQESILKLIVVAVSTAQNITIRK